MHYGILEVITLRYSQYGSFTDSSITRRGGHRDLLRDCLMPTILPSSSKPISFDSEIFPSAAESFPALTGFFNRLYL
jgi:hypothetical protein